MREEAEYFGATLQGTRDRPAETDLRIGDLLSFACVCGLDQLGKIGGKRPIS